ncbi:hypothetical protein [Pseudomonas siliginis]|uniref:hypothetical protein n=1 Tax=Pseudomonas siliginis TaxID=2842346 RepID=UPI002093A776|nr:hypothetical protein [Pseudomonas siliginis]UST82142.1 hypothetical protein NF676_12735 [Pseudomonas siliginis]
MRTRLSESPVGKKLTYSHDISLAECESFILESALEMNSYRQWVAHLIHFRLQIMREPDPYSVGSDIKDFLRLKDLIQRSLESAGYSSQAFQIKMSTTELDLNNVIIEQYTSSESLYREANLLLRDGHGGRDIGKDSLTPWILQLNAAIRRRDEYMEVSYRGAKFTRAEIKLYNPGEMFIWAPFTSASKSRESCLGGNVLFEFLPTSPLSEYGKRAPRDISAVSMFPEEEEVLFPICCAFRVTSKENMGAGQTVIRLDVLDHH